MILPSVHWYPTQHTMPVTYLPKVGRVAQHVHIKELRHISTTICIVLLSKR